ncbi:MAG: hypothetical protein HC802_08190 [Caldilineaceae bacterium]|nr:hypothetical protein [Caldilineaceae bacterium]
MIQFTTPVDKNAARDYGQVHALCNKPFGPEWVHAGRSEAEVVADYLPLDQPFWIWDGMAGSLAVYAP